MAWRENLKEEELIFNFKNTDTLTLKFLNEGIMIPVKQIIKDDGSIITIKNSIAFRVINNKSKKEGKFNVNSKRLKIVLRDISETLTNKTITIVHHKGEVETDNYYTAKLIK